MNDNTHILTSDGELYHYGVKGMKWGVRKFQQKSSELDNKKTAMKKAKKAYNKSFNKAYNRAIAAYSPSKKHRTANDKRWNDVSKKAEAYNKAKADYKSAKKEFHKNTTVGQKLGRGYAKATPALNKIGGTYLYDQMFNDGRGTQAAKTALTGVGILTISAIAKSRGATDIHWYDKQGRKIV